MTAKELHKRLGKLIEGGYGDRQVVIPDYLMAKEQEEVFKNGGTGKRNTYDVFLTTAESLKVHSDWKPHTIMGFCRHSKPRECIEITQFL